MNFRDEFLQYERSTHNRSNRWLWNDRAKMIPETDESFGICALPVVENISH